MLGGIIPTLQHPAGNPRSCKVLQAVPTTSPRIPAVRDHDEMSPQTRLIHRVVIRRDPTDSDGSRQALAVLEFAERATRLGAIILDVRRPHNRVRTVEITALMSILQLVEMMFDEVQHELAADHSHEGAVASELHGPSSALTEWIDHTERAVRAAALPRFASLLAENGI